MDASENPEKASGAQEPTAHPADNAGAIAANSNIPTVESPSVVPGQDEHVGEHVDAPAAASPVTALVVTRQRADYAHSGTRFGAGARDKARAAFAAFTGKL